MEFDIVAPIFGFEDVKKIKLEKIDDMFFKIIADKVSFTLINPFSVKPDYDFELDDAQKELLQLDNNTNFLVLNIMVVARPIENSTINFAAPMIFNIDKKIAGQIILDTTKHNYLLDEPLRNFIKE